MNSRVACRLQLPSGPIAPVTPDGKPAARPMAGPVVPLTVGARHVPRNCWVAPETVLPHGDAIATRVLVKGEPVAAPRGRADDFALKPDGDGKLRRAAAAACRSLAAAPAETARPNRQRPPDKAAAPERNAPAAKTTQMRPRHPGEPPVRSAGRNGTTCPARRVADLASVRRRLPLADAVAVAVEHDPPRQRGSVVDPIRNLSTACAAWRPSRIAHTTSDWPRRMSPAANTLGTECLVGHRCRPKRCRAGRGQRRVP